MEQIEPDNPNKICCILDSLLPLAALCPVVPTRLALNECRGGLVRLHLARVHLKVHGLGLAALVAPEARGELPLLAPDLG